ncbi:MAG TPA: 1,4-alpha-glucan branching protein [Streptosporangiaceae bacterium]|nr:1,4-alpha-glucan branching protein [Streptosporangiaceae bacterium]
MAIIHETTVTPSKLDLLKAWLPAQPWYLGAEGEPDLTRAGGFRLDDPAGEVGIEFMVVTDGSGDEGAAYLVPLTYRGRALDGGEGALVGTMQHGVLGHRWIYDGTRDPVLAAQLAALIRGEAEPQAQSISNTPDPTVIVTPVAGGGPGGQLAVRINRVLRSGEDGGTDAGGSVLADGGTGAGGNLRADGGLGAAEAAPDGQPWQPCLSATWRRPDGTLARGFFASARPQA